MKRFILAALFLCLPKMVFAAQVFSIDYADLGGGVNVIAPTEINQGFTGRTLYTVTNTSPVALNNISLRSQAGVTAGLTDVDNNCLTLSSLASGGTCNLEINVNQTNTPTGIAGGSGPKLCAFNGLYCAQPPTAKQLNVTVEPEPTEAMPELTTNSGLTLTPGDEATLNITNDSDAVVQFIQFSLPNAIAEHVSTDNDCELVFPGDSCTATFEVGDELSENDFTESGMLIQGANTQQKTVELSFGGGSGALSAEDLTFATPSSETLTITNDGSAAAAVESINTEAPGIQIGSFSQCSTIESGQSCSVTVTADPGAYGDSTPVEVVYDAGSGQQVLSVNLTVANTSLQVNNGQPIELSGTGTTSVSIENTGSFVAQDVLASLGGELTNVTIDQGSCGLDTTVAIGESCTATLLHLSGVTPGESAGFTGIARNADTAGVEVTTTAGGPSELTVTANTDSENQYLYYRRIDVLNNSGSDITINNQFSGVSVGLSGKVEQCQADGSNCDGHQSTCEANVDETLSAGGGSCVYWLKAANGLENSLGETEGSFTIATDESNGVVTVPVVYQNQLYVAGDFDTQTDDGTTLNVASWDGTSWAAVAGNAVGNERGLGRGDNDTVRALTLYKGNLIAGGFFDDNTDGTVTNNLAQWNSQTWQPLGADANNGTNTLPGANAGVFAVAGGTRNSDSRLFFGGRFSKINSGDSDDIDANNVGSWDGSTYTNLPQADPLTDIDYGLVNSDEEGESLIRVIFDPDNYVRFGGVFNKSPTNADLNNFAFWDPNETNTPWGEEIAPSGSSINDAINFSSGTVEVGEFDDDCFVASWGVCLAEQPNAVVNAVTEVFGRLVIGGDFTEVNDGTAANRVAWWNAEDNEWLPVGDGVNGTVYALTTFNQPPEGAFTLFAAGNFTTAGGNPAKRVAYWNGTEWLALGNGIDQGEVRAMLIAPSLGIQDPEAAVKSRSTGKKTKAAKH